MVGAKVPTMEDPVEKAVVGGVKWLHWIYTRMSLVFVPKNARM